MRDIDKECFESFVLVLVFTAGTSTCILLFVLVDCLKMDKEKRHHFEPCKKREFFEKGLLLNIEFKP